MRLLSARHGRERARNRHRRSRTSAHATEQDHKAPSFPAIRELRRRPEANEGGITKRPKQRKFGTILERFGKNGERVAWQARYTNPLDPSKKVQRNFSPDSKDSAEQWLDEERYLVRLHNLGVKEWRHPTKRRSLVADAEKARRMPFNDFCDLYYETHRAPDGSELSYSRREVLKRSLTRLKDYFGSEPVCEITPGEIEHWYSGRKDQLTPSMFWHECVVISQLFNHASKKILADGKPMLAYNPCSVKHPQPKSRKADQLPFTKDKVCAIVNAMPDNLQLMVWLAALVGGLRVGEACALRLRDLDLDNRILHVRHSVNKDPDHAGSFILDTTKTKAGIRDVPIPMVLIPMIRKHIREHCDDKTPDSMLFQRHSPLTRNTMYTQDSVAHQFERARKAANRPDATFHTLRATHATMLMLNGATMRETMDNCGHADLQVAFEHYQKIVPAHLRKVVELLSYDFLQDDVSKETLRDVLEKLRAERDDLDDKIEQVSKRLNGK